ncbi:MAG: hypothetical protein WKF54_14420, partial [Nocardioidaceae bacterium]
TVDDGQELQELAVSMLRQAISPGRKASELTAQPLAREITARVAALDGVDTAEHKAADSS